MNKLINDCTNLCLGSRVLYRNCLGKKIGYRINVFTIYCVTCWSALTARYAMVTDVGRWSVVQFLYVAISQKLSKIDP